MATEFSDEVYGEITGSEKRVGCIGGFFQLFDCQQLLGQGHMKDASGNDPIPINQTTDRLLRSLEKGRIRKCQEKSRDSMESSRTSLSSSFTSFSSLEHKSPQEVPIYVHRSFFSKSPRNSPRSPAFKDIIKESIYKNVRDALMFNKDENKINREMKPIHSPRSMDLCKIDDLDESLRILYKLKDSPRFSYDGTENTQTVIDMKQNSIHKQFSRHSLDSKEESLRCNLSPKFNSALKKFNKEDDRKVSLNQIRETEISQKSPNIVAKLMGLEPLDESKHERPLQSPRNTTNMKQKSEYLLERGLKKVQYQHSSNELHDPKLATIETKNKKLSSVSSPRAQIVLPNHKLNKVSTSEGAIKSPIVVLEPARKFDACFSEVAELEGTLDLEKIRTSGLSKRKKDIFKRQINTISPRLQQIKGDMEKKVSSSIPTCEMIKSPRLYVNCQSSDSLSPRCKLRQKPKLKDSELQNSVDHVNVEEYRAKRLFEMKTQLMKSIQGSSIKISTRPVSEEKKYSVILKDLSANELELVHSPQRSSPNFVLDALLKEGGLTHSPVSASKVLKAECQDLPSDRTLQIHPSILSSRKNRQKQEGIETIFRKTRVLGRTNEELHAADGYATEIFQASGLLHEESDLLSMFDQINSNNPSKFVEKINPKKLQQKLISDTVNEILSEKIEVFSSHAYTIKSLQDCREKSLDENSMIHRKLLRSSQVWDSFKGEVPVIVLEIERLMFKDLINEVVNGETAVFLEAKHKWCRRQQFARNGI